MSAGIKPVSKDHSGSGIPLPRTMTTFSKQKPAQYQSGGQIASSSTVNSKELLREASSRIRYQVQRPTQLKTSFNHMTGSRSAYSSPQVSKKKILYSKDTLDLRNVSRSPDRYQDQTGNGNKNWKTNQGQFKSLDNTDTPSSSYMMMQGIQTEKACLRSTNRNLIWGSSSCNRAGFTKQKNKFKNGSNGKDVKPCKLQKTKGSESPRMAAVAPFRFKLQVQEDTDMSSLEDVSDCSSDSMEVCCEDFVMSPDVAGNISCLLVMKEDNGGYSFNFLSA
ncbi:hypothetical protein Baya_8242 [Bagarius yarrelli]|uniref:Uncharacterized protein n=1 Tax=Bagarius yarrelli TaxID=175774 RepID=A0A556U3L9_BAGYA|nr:hypothetical protein Baya_8242 [Bagarius yarrelli]